MSANIIVTLQREQVLRSTGHSSTIQIEEKLFDTFKSCDLRLGFSSTWEQQLSKIKLVEEKKKKIDRLMLTSTNDGHH